MSQTTRLKRVGRRVTTQARSSIEKPMFPSDNVFPRPVLLRFSTKKKKKGRKQQLQHEI